MDAALEADDAFHGVFVTAAANAEIPRALARLMPRIRRLERLRFGSLSGRASVKQHAEILAAAPEDAAALVKQNWLSLGALIDRSFEMTAIAPPDIHDADTLGAARALLDAAADPEAMQQEVLDAVARNEQWRGNECVNLLAPEALVSPTVQ